MLLGSIVALTIGFVVGQLVGKVAVYYYREGFRKTGVGILTGFTVIITLLLFTGCAGPRGETGAQGERGIEGVPGQDGADGQDGRDGQDAVVEIIDPCGKQSDFDELLFRLSDGNLMAYFERGGKRFLTVIPPGEYVTTDGTKCKFTVTSEGEVVSRTN